MVTGRVQDPQRGPHTIGHPRTTQERGVQAIEAWLVSAAHDDDTVNRVLYALPPAASAAAAASAPEP